MKKTLLLLLAISCVFVLACSGSRMKVNFDYDKNENFENLTTYDFMPFPEYIKVNQELHDIIKENINQNLSSRGYKRAEVTPKFLIAVHSYVQGRLIIADWGYTYAKKDTYWKGSGLWKIGTMDAYTYKGGTLVIDFVEAGNKKLVWRGVAQSVLPEDLQSEETRGIINKAVAEILKHFPPEK